MPEAFPAAKSTLKWPCGKPWQMLLFTAIMKTLTSRFTSSANVRPRRKSPLWSETKERGFDSTVLPNPTAAEQLESTHGRGIYLMNNVDG